MNKQEIEQKRNEAIETAKKNDEIYYTSDIEGFKKGFDAAVKLFSMHFVSNNEARVTVCCSTCKHVGKFGEDSACNNCFQNYNKWEQAN